jgi:hypothetical protein
VWSCSSHYYISPRLFMFSSRRLVYYCNLYTMNLFMYAGYLHSIYSLPVSVDLLTSTR